MLDNLCFTIWMLLFPLVSFHTQSSKEYDRGVEGMAGLANIIVWFVVGSLLYVPR